MAGEDNQTAMVDMVVEKVWKKIEPRLKLVEADEVRVPKAKGGDSLTAIPYHRGKFDYTPITDDLEEVYCPGCGSFERRPIKTKEVVKEVERIPEGYEQMPDDVSGVLAMLERPHKDGASVWDCPNCSKLLSDFTKQHIDDLKKIGFDVKEQVKKK